MTETEEVNKQSKEKSTGTRKEFKITAAADSHSLDRVKIQTIRFSETDLRFRRTD